MDIGIGLPSTIPGVTRGDLLPWARRAEERGFSSLGTIDRLVYSNYESLVALAAAAAVTERIRLLTDILLAPLRGNGAVLAKQAATIDALSGGRMSLGVGVGLRADDYEAAGVAYDRRGQLMDDLLAEMRAAWGGEERGFAGPIGPPPAGQGGPELLIGGTVEAAIRRVVRFGDGWTMGGGAPDDFRKLADGVKEAWAEAGREGEPRLVALCYYALGDGARDAVDAYIGDYYGFGGQGLVEAIAGSAAVDASMVAAYRDGFADAGADELIYFPSSTDVSQVDLLADALL